MSKITILMMSAFFGLNALADCKDFSGVYQQGENVMTVKQTACTKIDYAKSNSNGIWAQFSIVPGTDNSTLPEYLTGNQVHAMDSFFIDADMFGEYQVFYEYTGDYTVTSTDVFRVNDKGDLLETAISTEDKVPAITTNMPTYWKRTQDLK